MDAIHCIILERAVSADLAKPSMVPRDHALALLHCCTVLLFDHSSFLIIRVIQRSSYKLPYPAPFMSAKHL